MEKRLYRSPTNRVLLGICGGLGEYFSVDPTIMRVVVVVIIVLTSIVPGILAYFVLGLIIPLKGASANTPGESMKENLQDIRDSTNKLGENIRSTFSGTSGADRGPIQESGAHVNSKNGGLLILGVVIVVIGVAFLLWNVFGWLFRYLWPAVLVLAGVLIIVAVVSRKS
jgi:phage shock protein C